jgi:prolyl 4-hydroxylase
VLYSELYNLNLTHQYPDCRIHNLDIQLYSIPNFLSNSDCAKLIEIGKPYFKPSRVTGAGVDLDFRSSTTSKLTDDEPDNSLVQGLHTKCFELYGRIDLTSDPMQIQKYQIGQQFKDHQDFHDPQTSQKVIDTKGQRNWTFMLYLDEGCVGGETVFPRININIKPTTGTLLAWNNLYETGEGNWNSTHRGNPVIDGEKNIITKWFRSKRL